MAAPMEFSRSTHKHCKGKSLNKWSLNAVSFIEFVKLGCDRKERNQIPTRDIYLLSVLVN